MNWELENGKLKKKFQLRSFSEIIYKLNQINLIANELDHHPDVLIENYDQVTFYVYNHQENQSSHKNEELVKRITALFETDNEV